MEATIDTKKVRSWKRYEDLRDFEVEWLGKVPAHWETRRLTTVCDFASGKAHEPYVEEGAKYVCVNSRFVSTGGATRKYCTENLSPARKNDILMVMSDLPNGRALAKAFFVEEDDLYAVNQRVCIITPEKAQHSRFLYYLLDRNPVFLRFDDGFNQTHLSNAVFTKFPLLIPPLAEQRAIVAFLDRETARIDALIGHKERLIALLEEKRQAVITHAVIRGLNPRAKMKSSKVPWLGEIPDHWQVAPLKHAVLFQEGPGLRQWQFTSDGIRVICVTNITEAGIDFSTYQKFISENEYEQHYRHFTVRKGDLLLSSSGNSWGKVAEYQDDTPVILNTSTIRVYQNRQAMYRRPLIKWTLQSVATREQLELMMTGSCQPNFGPSHLANVLVAIPPVDEQSEIAQYLDEKTQGFSDLKLRVLSGIQRLQEYRSALISAAVTGQIDVCEEVLLND